jgi:hypothetical protein
MSLKKNIEIRYHSPIDLKEIHRIKDKEGIVTNTKLLTFLLQDYTNKRNEILKLKSDNLRLQLGSSTW